MRTRAGAVSGALPNLVVIGAMKAGTSALHHYLGLHPEVQMSRPKELDFFVDGRIAERADWRFDREDLRIERTLRANWGRGIRWYRRHFTPAAPVRGEASPSYTAPWYPDVAERMAQVVPEARLVFVARDPVDRAVSNYAHQRALGRERRPIEDALGDLRTPYVARSRYALALEPFLRSYPRSQVLVLTREELLTNREQTVRALYRFAGVDDSFRSQELQEERYGGESRVVRGPVARLIAGSPVASLARRLPDSYRQRGERVLSGGRRPEAAVLPSALRGRLEDGLRDDVARLERLTGRHFPEWSVRPGAGV